MFAILISLLACGGPEEEDKGDTPTEEVEAVAEEPEAEEGADEEAPTEEPTEEEESKEED